MKHLALNIKRSLVDPLKTNINPKFITYPPNVNLDEKKSLYTSYYSCQIYYIQSGSTPSLYKMLISPGEGEENSPGGQPAVSTAKQGVGGGVEEVEEGGGLDEEGEGEMDGVSSTTTAKLLQEVIYFFQRLSYSV